jgi:hypothetical protein
MKNYPADGEFSTETKKIYRKQAKQEEKLTSIEA